MTPPDKKYMRREDEAFEVRVMAETEGWSMVRRKGCVPFVCESRFLFDTLTEAAAWEGDDEK